MDWTGLATGNPLKMKILHYTSTVALFVQLHDNILISASYMVNLSYYVSV